METSSELAFSRQDGKQYELEQRLVFRTAHAWATLYYVIDAASEQGNVALERWRWALLTSDWDPVEVGDSLHARGGPQTGRMIYRTVLHPLQGH